MPRSESKPSVYPIIIASGVFGAQDSASNHLPSGRLKSLGSTRFEMPAQARSALERAMFALASYDGEARLIAYNATKAGVLGIVHTAANESVCPDLQPRPATYLCVQG